VYLPSRRAVFQYLSTLTPDLLSFNSVWQPVITTACNVLSLIFIIQQVGWLVGWTSTSLFSTNTAISD